MQEKTSTLDFIKTSFGNILEWYDFSLYGIFTVYISRAFFPNSNQFLSLLMTFLTFSVSFLARPVGSLIFGYIGDKMGKHYSVNISIWCMAIPTVIVGLLPTYATVGIIAPISLILLRIIQGVSVGGQFSGLITIAVDSPKNNRSYLVSLILAISVVGSLLATFVGLISVKIFSALPESFVWRIPFLLSGVLFYIYLKLKPEFEKASIDSEYSLKEIFKTQPYELLYMTLLSAVMAAIYYILFNYFITYMEIHLHASSSVSLLVMNLVLFVSLVGYPLFGKLADNTSDRINSAKWFTLLFCLAVILLSVKLEFSWTIMCLVLMVVAYCAIASSLTSMFGEIFDDKYRMTACSMCYNAGAILGGFSPFISEILAKKTVGGFYMFLLSAGFILYTLQDKISQTIGYKKFIAPKKII